MSREEVAALLGIAPVGAQDPRPLRHHGHRINLERQARAVQKVPTHFLRVPREINPTAAWVLDGEAVATRKYDDTCVMLDDDGAWWARREAKPLSAASARLCGRGDRPRHRQGGGWGPIEQSPFAKFWQDAVDTEPVSRPGTYELIGPRVNGNPEQSANHQLVWHNAADVVPDVPVTFDGLRAVLTSLRHEGIVWHHPGGRMAKLKRRDFPAA